MSDSGGSPFPVLGANDTFQPWWDSCENRTEGDQKLFGTSEEQIAQWQTSRIYAATRNYHIVGNSIQLLFDQKKNPLDTTFRSGGKIEWVKYRDALRDKVKQLLDETSRTKKKQNARQWQTLANNGYRCKSFQLMVDSFEILVKEMKNCGADSDVPVSLKGEAMFACFPRYNQKKMENDWNEDDLSDYDKIMAEAKRLAAKSYTNAIDEPPDGPPVWVKAQSSMPNPPKQKSPIVKEEVTFVGGAGFPPRGKGHRGGRGRGNAESGRGGY
uniref:Uncharacterized protein n=1 Tax=Chromera velia CCMP2878 TaxID=1169474 RepID=A0A0G4I2G5_9ALVE|eukprot:Cvel_10321.t1-p1 / transcript=Cvel_10321.t1 / gene=Cvel_10321 / organism=Chromera_velia_CCMP2878 / gene_product=hypothetical protein / transcript_product=hypothetical protein / location=Cvel_scaffold620:10340-11146(+) / protein_length=269 / sequence_SO=supercontig / SO=protein_coding / is_pseudo=false